LRAHDGYDHLTLFEEVPMGIALLLIVLGLIVGGVGLFATALKWTLIIALVLLVAGIVRGFADRGTTVP
jgi:hypothetical protein